MQTAADGRRLDPTLQKLKLCRFAPPREAESRQGRAQQGDRRRLRHRQRNSIQEEKTRIVPEIEGQGLARRPNHAAERINRIAHRRWVGQAEQRVGAKGRRKVAGVPTVRQEREGHLITAAYPESSDDLRDTAQRTDRAEEGAAIALEYGRVDTRALHPVECRIAGPSPVREIATLETTI